MNQSEISATAPLAEPRLPEVSSAQAEATRADGHESQLVGGIMLARRVIHGFRNITEEDAEDLAQEIGILYLSRHAGVDNPMAWFYECARRAALRHLDRKVRRQPRKVAMPETAAPEADENGLSVKRFFFALSAHCRNVLGCMIIEGRTLEETAAVSGRSVNQVYALKQRCLKLLRARWLHGRIPLAGETACP